MTRHIIFLFSMIVFVTACTDTDKTKIAPPSTEPDPMISPDWSPEQVAAYEKCLEDSMAFGMGWEIIQQDCANSVVSSFDPLGVK